MAANLFHMLDLLEVAAEPNRRRLLQLLARGEQTVTQLSAAFPVSRSAISQHLLLLAEAGLVTARKDGRNRLYRLEESGMSRLRRVIDQFWTTELDQLVDDAAHFHQQTLQGDSDGLR
ncbi:MAG: helix-turn-helix domain-containing protein [Actinomycetota bacterium]|nr:helix-turn-helix domain-containing protein [Actinomycetota bacterium]